MNPLIELKKATPLFVIPCVLACFALLPGAQAVEPAAPAVDRGGGNTSDGAAALGALTTGTFNSAFGFDSLAFLTDSTFNTGIGAGALTFNNATDNTAVGAGTLFGNTTGVDNTACGGFALFTNSTGGNNTAVGASALLSNTTGTNNTATGNIALATNSDGNGNTATGDSALGLSSIGNGNTATGSGALLNNTTGSSNIALGQLAGSNLTTGDNNIDIGNSGVADESNTIRIGDPAVQTVNPATFIAGISGTAVVGVPVVVDGNGQLGTATSSARFKKDIKPMDKTSEAILSLKPVSFQYKSDSKGIPQFGLIAEEVAQVNPDLVVRDQNGEIYTVRYDAVNAMLLNEFLKEHRKVEQQRKDFEAALAQQQKQIEALSAGLQKVNAQLEVSKPAPQTVLNNQ
jgi:hypothetical protein